ncbi:MAG: DNA polymerase III subunit gamma/tau [Planctomycetota bacterium]
MSEPESVDESNDAYVVVARRYRPRNFAELVGQDHVGRALTNAIETGRVGHAYLFTGARGVGKTSTARIFAKALNNPGGPNATPDNDSDVAQAIDSGEDIDVIEIDGASNRGIDEIRQLRSSVGVRPSRSRFKIYIIDEVHMLTQAAFNALLKTLEEPPEHVKFIFCTTDPEKMPITVLSRCQRFDFAPVEVPKIVQRLREIIEAENATADDSALELIARRAAGSMRDSQSLLEQVLSFSDGNLTADQVHAMLGTADDERLHALAGAMSRRDAAEALRQLDSAVDAGVDAGRFAEQLLGYFRDLMAVTVGCDESLQRHTAASMHPELKALGEQWGLQTVLAVVGLIDDTLVRIRLSVYARVLLEATVIQICNLPDLQAIADLAEAAGSGGSLTKPQKKKPLNNDVPAPGETATRPSVPPAAPASQHVATKAESRPVPKEQEPIAPAKENLEAAGNEATVSPSTRRELTTSTVREVFSEALTTVEQMVASAAALATRVDLEGSSQVRLVYASDNKMAMDRMDRPENRSAVCDAIKRLTGREVAIALQVDATATKAVAAKPTARPSAKERMERMREIESNPWVQACVETFQAEIIKVDVQ